MGLEQLRLTRVLEDIKQRATLYDAETAAVDELLNSKPLLRSVWEQRTQARLGITPQEAKKLVQGTVNRLRITNIPIVNLRYVPGQVKQPEAEYDIDLGQLLPEESQPEATPGEKIIGQGATFPNHNSIMITPSWVPKEVGHPEIGIDKQKGSGVVLTAEETGAFGWLLQLRANWNVLVAELHIRGIILEDSPFFGVRGKAKAMLNGDPNRYLSSLVRKVLVFASETERREAILREQETDEARFMLGILTPFTRGEVSSLIREFNNRFVMP